MGFEIERRFLLDALPPADVVGELAGGEPIRQGYLAAEGSVTVRLRRSPAGDVLTIKGGTSLRRTEVEVALAGDDAEQVWELTEGRRLEKVRHRLPVGGDGGPVAEVDVFGGGLAGLLLVEVEFPSEHDAEAFVPPAWFGTEVTGRPEWSNASLALRGRPDRRTGGSARAATDDSVPRR